MAVCGVLLAGCGSKKADDKVLSVGMECAYAPFNWTQKDDSNGAVKLGIAVKKGNTDLKDKLNKALSEISEEEREQIMQDAIKDQPLS